MAPPGEVVAAGSSERGRIASTILLAGAVVSALGLLASIALQTAPVAAHTSLAAMLTAHGVALALLRARLERTAVAVFAALYLAMVSNAMWRFGGVHAPAGMTLPPLVLFVGLTWSGRAAFVTALLAAGCLALFSMLEHTGRLVRTTPVPSSRVVLVAAVVLMATGMMLAVALRIIERSRAQAAASQHAHAQLQVQLARAQRLESVGRLAAGVAHDFNNVLTVVVMEAQRLQRGKGGSDAAANILAAADRAAALTRQLLAFGRQQVVEPEPLDLGEVLSKLESLLRAFVGENVRFERIVEPDLPALCADRVEIEQLLLNLVTNARDAMPQGGTLIVRASRATPEILARCAFGALPPARAVCLSVQDTGTGMSEETKSKLFEPFFTTKSVGRGTGLGLATVRGIVERLEGALLVDTELGRGSTFTAVFPIAQAPAMPAPKAEVARQAVRATPYRIVVLDDLPLLRSALAELLSEAGYSVSTAASATELLDAAKSWSTPPDLLLTDVVMPDLSGPELVRRLRERAPALKVMFMSGYAQEQLSKQGIPVEGVHFIAKPFEPAALCAKLARILEWPGIGSAGVSA